MRAFLPDYTEHHDVIREWNGYWRYDRSLKYTGLGDLVEGISIRDFHSDVYLSTGNDICLTVKAGETHEVPLYLSSMTGRELGNQLEIAYVLDLTNTIGEISQVTTGNIDVDYKPYIQNELSPLTLKMPYEKGVAILKLFLKDKEGQVIHRNFMHFEITEGQAPAGYQVLSKLPSDFSNSRFAGKKWEVLDGKKVNGTGKGYIEYTFELPKDLKINRVKEIYFVGELGAKQLFIKDMTNEEKAERGLDLNYRKYPDSNPNAYPMSDETMFPFEISIYIDGEKMTDTVLPDDPADHRGVLSWHHQVILEPEKDQSDLDNWSYTLMGRLEEAGSYGYLIKTRISKASVKKAIENSGEIVVKLATKGDGGLAVYGREFGRYPVDPSIVIKR